MSIISTSLDYKSAAIDVRERFSYTSTRIREILRSIKAADGVSGAVLLCTCNRTELYISGENIENLNPALLLCQLSGVGDHNLLMPLFSIRYDSEAIFHLMEVACGLQSMVFFEDQIITQVKYAAAIAREEKTIDSTLETLFRLGITAAKKAKTEIKIKAVPTSAAESAITELSKKYCFSEKRVLVIGNGEIGRLCCKKLIELGADVTITLRKYKHGDIIVPIGCSTISYDEREEFLSSSDVVISATTSPHFTITCDMVEKLERRPELFVDLALPRDIEPGISQIPGVESYNLDRFYTDFSVLNQKEVSEIKEIIHHYNLQFEKWKNYHRKARLVNNMNRINVNY
ncbi:glutamyl-tRNA reductase [Ruminiclostridium papyrosolvens]|uniref:Glutamyl-tRNA reductase n=1 Tax=Ruminiclostridium papyrosolvens C7 TaxID=1330534 RepID=U4QXZ4_9FIRM|nr:glutamyl-tRNA reductase [Ruminiclostridium papyrosolvens]EPR09346.1 Tetrapyrrole biosynthesis, glutamyl-tRNA reductase [Ruminiclostridium papyrosolvens C7]